MRRSVGDDFGAIYDLQVAILRQGLQRRFEALGCDAGWFSHGGPRLISRGESQDAETHHCHNNR
jgi:hypothetical protein